eukprot:g2320.t1
MSAAAAPVSADGGPDCRGPGRGQRRDQGVVLETLFGFLMQHRHELEDLFAPPGGTTVGDVATGRVREEVAVKEAPAVRPLLDHKEENDIKRPQEQPSAGQAQVKKAEPLLLAAPGEREQKEGGLTSALGLTSTNVQPRAHGDDRPAAEVMSKRPNVPKALNITPKVGPINQPVEAEVDNFSGPSGWRPNDGIWGWRPGDNFLWGQVLDADQRQREALDVQACLQRTARDLMEKLKELGRGRKMCQSEREMARKLAALEEKAQESDSKRVASESKSREAEEKLADAEEKLSNTKEKLADAEKEVAVYEAKVQAAERRAAGADSQRAELETKLSEAEAAQAEAEQTLTNWTAKAAAEKAYAAAEKRAAEAVEDAKNRCHQLARDLALVKSQRDKTHQFATVAAKDGKEQRSLREASERKIELVTQEANMEIEEYRVQFEAFKRQAIDKVKVLLAQIKDLQRQIASYQAASRLDITAAPRTQLTEVKAYNNEDAETARDLPRLPSLQSKSSKKKALELGAVVLSDNLFRRPFTTSFTLKTNAANLPVVQVHASGAASSSGNAPATAFCICAPTVPGEDPQRSVHFSFSSPVEAEQKKRTAMLEEQKARLLPLLSQMPQAAFLGHGTETKRDTPKGVTFTKRVTTVRDALQLPADKFQVEVGGVPLADYLKQCGALARIQSGLQIETGIDIELYSLNVYQQGGHFLKHKDTPRGDDTFGTLVVGLGGCYYEGGSMTISDSALPHIFAHDLLGLGFGDPSSVQVPDPTMLRCAAFFSDFDHELHEVTSGILMTVAFLMKRADKSSAASLIPRRLTQLEQEKKLADMLRELLHDKEFLANGGTVGFPCSHLYTNSEVFPGKDRAADRALTGQQILQLKGKDAVIGRAVDTVQRKVGGDLELFLTPYLTYYPDVFSGILTPWGDYLLSRFPVGTKVPRRMDDDEIARHFKAIGDASDHLVGEVGRTRLRARDMVDVWALPEEFSHRAKFAGQT